MDENSMNSLLFKFMVASARGGRRLFYFDSRAVALLDISRSEESVFGHKGSLHQFWFDAAGARNWRAVWQNTHTKHAWLTEHHWLPSLIFIHHH